MTRSLYYFTAHLSNIGEAFEQYWRKLRPAFFARNLLLCHALDRSDLCSDPCDPALFIRENRKPKHF